VKVTLTKRNKNWYLPSLHVSTVKLQVSGRYYFYRLRQYLIKPPLQVQFANLEERACAIILGSIITFMHVSIVVTAAKKLDEAKEWPWLKWDQQKKPYKH
jgi:hypothetical protein